MIKDMGCLICIRLSMYAYIFTCKNRLASPVACFFSICGHLFLIQEVLPLRLGSVITFPSKRIFMMEILIYVLLAVKSFVFPLISAS